MYGQGFEYVVGAYNCLDKEKNRDMLLFLQMHMHTSTGFYSYFGERTKWKDNSSLEEVISSTWWVTFSWLISSAWEFLGSEKVEDARCGD